MQFLEAIRALASPHRGGAFPDALAALARHFPSGTFSTDRYREFLRALFERTLRWRPGNKPAPHRI